MTTETATPLKERKSNIWARDPDDWYVESEWCSARLFEVEKFDGGILDPACGMGRIVMAARLAGYQTFGSDIVKRSDYCDMVSDWLELSPLYHANIVCNPPFKHCNGPDFPFVARCLERARSKVALLLPSNWLNGNERGIWLASTPLYRVYYLTPRPSMPPGSAIEADQKPGNGTTDYAWLVWLKGYEGSPTLHWLRRDG